MHYTILKQSCFDCCYLCLYRLQLLILTRNRIFVKQNNYNDKILVEELSLVNIIVMLYY